MLTFSQNNEEANDEELQGGRENINPISSRWLTEFPDLYTSILLHGFKMEQPVVISDKHCIIMNNNSTMLYNWNQAMKHLLSSLVNYLFT